MEKPAQWGVTILSEVPAELSRLQIDPYRGQRNSAWPKMEGMQAGIQFAQTKPCNLLHPHGVGDACSGMQSRPKRLLFCFQPHISLLLKKRNEGPTVRPSLESRCQFHFPPWPPLLPSSFLSARFIAAPPLTHRVRSRHCFRWRHRGPFIIWSEIP